ncbi:lipid droplet-associated hydrolase [Rhypophila decipiens]
MNLLHNIAKMATPAVASISTGSGSGAPNARVHQPPPRRYPVARSKSRIPCVQFLSPGRGTSISKEGSCPRPTKHILVYFIPGNPGLAGYYTPFLETLRGLLDASYPSSGTGTGSDVADREVESSVDFDLYAQNLLGFDDSDNQVPFGTPIPGSENGDGNGQKQESLPFSLEDQICGVWDSLEEIVRSGLRKDTNVNDNHETTKEVDARSEKHYDQVILMGHSVGAYIGIEIFHRHHQLLALSHQQTDPDPDPENQKEVPVPFNLLAGIMLFPTIWDIAKSPNGLVFNRFIRNNAFMSNNAHKIAKWTVDWFPSWVLKSVVRNVMGFSDHGAETTTNFLTSRDGIHQALYLARDEMGSITEEKWEREMWEASHDLEQDDLEEQGGEGKTKKRGDRFFFLFGKKDHWVADKTRDAFIEKRKEQHGDKGRVRVLVDETGGEKAGIPHAFCIHHSEVVAERVKTWIDEIVASL